MFNKLKQFKDIRSKAKTIQAALAQESAEGSSGWGKVKIVVDGNQHCKSVTIDPSVMSDKTKLEELMRDAFNDAMQKIQKIMATKLKDVGGLDIAKDLQEMMGK
ncbi:MAG: YbaB/EbfC family nucleoid-associated protein [Patescibacteria group bacterium]